MESRYAIYMNKPRFLDRLFSSPEPEGPEAIPVYLGGAVDRVDVAIRRHPKAKRLSLRVDPAAGGAVVTLPRQTSRRVAEAFILQNADWLAEALAEIPDATPFTDGVTLQVLGQSVTVCHRPDRRSGVEMVDGEILVSGQAEHLPRRLRDFLKKQGKAEIEPLARSLADRLGARVGRVTLRDTRSRWGSCSAKGDLNFSWRLIFAPPEVLTYVVAHEVAHLRHMDHSAAFWDTVKDLHPDYKQDRAWLRENGSALHRIG